MGGDAAIYEFLDREAVTRAGERAPRRAGEPPAAHLVAAIARAVVRDLPRRREAVALGDRGSGQQR